MILQQLFRFSSIFRSAISVHLRRNIGLSAIVFNKAKELDPVQKLFIDKIREYNMKSQKAGGPADVGPEYQKDMAEEIAKIQRLYGGGDLTKFPDFKFEDLRNGENGQVFRWCIAAGTQCGTALLFAKSCHLIILGLEWFRTDICTLINFRES
ncbi:ATP synthase-coupling factor 6, mitochondrial isoform X1 [Dermochelys coriacea]|uniref:ATP synthase-coupling factor 6, mitochondrial isoform X1 n=1 Tax=Dermochelys coriacea TaxID=27794 RepID=UPI001CA7FE35|nr:ATP synthase-coupling factor 6, mitochondrial isoform X1 [Dermochelys coriacea]XP_043365062.1 ATP synthase-coupling factor 6, mitochondrial isoform X1 [Dermochelys coriacea]XP_043365064.1 ATP synthase-coupling factor 6, mitochondrial isoform X1 [Dermochelys coriacea]XP_043365069.1 ATP synthase-coupling factor 6, mitochondrial isoform X1 [Dermochelys coriacea]XP_043365072.1 ATP synthase-coupling factor 6, mitochondrial isoform X1 [Dermochelys coriacea]